jgi:hypothetical protein
MQSVHENLKNPLTDRVLAQDCRSQSAADDHDVEPLTEEF